MTDITLSSIAAELADLKAKMLEGFDKTNAQLLAIAGMEPTVNSINTTVNETATAVTEIAEAEAALTLDAIFKKHQVGNVARNAATVRALRTLATGHYGSALTPEELDRFLSVHPDFVNVCKHSLFGDRQGENFPWALHAVAYATHYTGKFGLFEDFLSMYDDPNMITAASQLKGHCAANENYAAKTSVIVLRCAAAFWAAHSGAGFDPNATGKIAGWDETAYLDGKI
jgi:hypothetical protein